MSSKNSFQIRGVRDIHTVVLEVKEEVNTKASFEHIRKVFFRKVKRRDVNLNNENQDHIDSREVQFGAEVLDPETANRYSNIREGDIWILTMLHCDFDVEKQSETYSISIYELGREGPLSKEYKVIKKMQ